VTGPGGVGIPSRQVRFDVVSGAFGIQSSDPANPLVQTLTVVSDVNGNARVILLASAGVPTQPALLRATDLTSGDQQTAQFTIVQTINGQGVLSVIPQDITFNGPDNTQCSNNFRGDYYIFGGTPPYQVAVTPSLPIAVILANVPVTMAGGFFSAITNGQCVDPATLVISDAAGLTTTVTLHNLVGTAAPPVPPTPSPLSIVPSVQSGTCNNSNSFAFAITGGTPKYNVAASQGAAVVQPNANGIFTVKPPVLASGSQVSIVGVDSGSPQLSSSATISCL